MSVFNPETKVWRGPQIPWPKTLDKYINELVIEGLKKTPKRVVQISYDDGTEATCEQMLSKIVKFALNLKKKGIKADDVVAVVCANSLDLMAYVNGIVQLGAIVNPMSVDHSLADFINMFKQTKPKFVVCDAGVYERVKESLAKLNNDAPIYTALKKIDNVPFVDELFNETGEEESYQPISFKDPHNRIMAILTSSGSSGPAKGVCMSQTFFLKLFLGVYKANEVARSLSFSPIFWGSAFGSLLLSAFSGETRVVTNKPFSVELFIDIASKYEVNYWLMNPPKLTLLLQSSLIEAIDKTPIRMILSLGGIVSEQMRKRFKEVFPQTYFLIFYGLTEVSCTAVFPGQPIDGLTVGYVIPNHEMKIVDDDGKALGIGETGEIYTKYSLVPFLVRFLMTKILRNLTEDDFSWFQGYYNNPAATKDALDEDGFIKTGDIGYVDERGFVYVIDRKKEIFKYKGHQINPSELENVIQALKAVEFVAVMGIPNDETYNLAAAVIKKKEGYGDLSEQDVVDFVAQKLPDYKQLHGGAFFVKEFPTTATAKILKRETKEILVKMYKERQKAN